MISAEKRNALLKVLAQKGEFEFTTDSLGSEEARMLFEGPRGVFEGYSRELAAAESRAEPIPFLYLSRSTLNARALRCDGHDFIGINWGTIVLLQDLFFRMMATPHVFSEIGDPDAELDFSTLPALPLDAALLPTAGGAPFEFPVTPQHPARAMYAIFLAQVTFDFIFIHEHQHIVGGHLAFLEQGRQGMAAIEQEPGVADLMTSHVLELEADAAAANFSLNIACDRQGNKWRIPEVLAPYLTTEKSRYRAWLFAVHTLFLIMEDASNRAFLAGRPGRTTHPVAVFKRGTMANLVFGRRGPFKKLEKAIPVGFEMLIGAHEALASVVDGREKFMIGVDLFGPGQDDGHRLLVRRWREMRPRLQELASANGAQSAPADLIATFSTGW